jgi:hypothetical protein
MLAPAYSSSKRYYMENTFHYQTDGWLSSK